MTAFAGFEFEIRGLDKGFVIRPSMSGAKDMIWIGVACGDSAGEGGDFPVDKLLEVVEKFYNEHF